MTEKNAMEILAEAAFYIPELVRGLSGSFEINEDGWGNGDYHRALTETHDTQRALIEAGWRRDRPMEHFAPYTHNVVIGVYRKKFEKETQWVVVELTTRFGLHATFEGMKRKPW